MGIPASPSRLPRTSAARGLEWVNHAVRAKADARRGEARRSECVTQVQRGGAEGPEATTRAGDRRRWCFAIWRLGRTLIAIAVDKHG